MKKLIAFAVIAATPALAAAQSQLGNSTGTQASATPTDPNAPNPAASRSHAGHMHGSTHHKTAATGSNPHEATGPH